MSTRVPEQPCPKCGMKLDAASSINDPEMGPEVGDITVCIGCSQILVFEEGFTLRRFTSVDLEKLTPEQAWELGKAQGAVIKFLLQKDGVQRGR